MIIVEGPDGGGKSTLVKKLHKDFGIALSDASQASDEERNDPSFRERENVRKRVYGAVLREVTARHPPELHDRLYYSEAIYSHILGRTPAFNYEEEVAINRVLNALRVPVIFCLPPWEAISQKYLSVGQMEGVPENALKIYEQYKQLAGFMGHAKDRKTYVNRQGKGKRMPQNDYTFPPVVIHDFTKKKSRAEIDLVVAQYLQKRSKRRSSWS